ncbi:hypothetical protein TI03_05345 [Achromatium sp. WMS1]|nr:hypothetical protein TI03_05345 [Achromatium sp. WMS1]
MGPVASKQTTGVLHDIDSANVLPKASIKDGATNISALENKLEYIIDKNMSNDLSLKLTKLSKKQTYDVNNMFMEIENIINI